MTRLALDVYIPLLAVAKSLTHVICAIVQVLRKIAVDMVLPRNVIQVKISWVPI